MFRGLLLALLLMEGVAWADDPLAQARQAVAESDYASARPELAAALEAGGHGPEDMAEIYRLSGIVAAALGDAKAATDAFTHLLVLSPAAQLPAGTSPKIKRPFEAASRFLKAHAPIEVKLDTVSTPPTITLVVVSDPLDMIARAHVAFTIDGGAEHTKDTVASERTDITLLAARTDAAVRSTTATTATGTAATTTGAATAATTTGAATAATATAITAAVAAAITAARITAWGGIRTPAARWSVAITRRFPL